MISVLGPAVCAGAGAQQPSGRPPVAQKPRAPPAPPRTVVGIVLDTGDVPIDSVEIRIVSLQRRTLSDVNGVFRFDDVRPGTFDVGARRLGFAPQVRRVTVGNDRGGSATFALLSVGYVLPPVVTRSPRGGLSGVIGDTAFNVMPGADVYVVGSGHRTRTDSAGTFFLDLKPGSYMVQVTSPGFARKLLSVSISADSGRHITVWMAPAEKRSNYREAEAIEQLRFRFMLRRATARFYSREDLNRYDFAWLRQLVVMGSGMPVADDCEVVIDGLERRPVSSLTLDEVESVEVYPPGSIPSAAGSIRRTSPPRSIDSRGTLQVPSGQNCPGVYVWTRR
jgi:carboxypeptidase family protein